MIFGIISIVIGAILFVNALLISPAGAPQQTVQYLGYVSSSIFFVGGLIMFTIVKTVQKKDVKKPTET